MSKSKQTPKPKPIFDTTNVNEWLADDNLLILQGYAMQCLTLDELADKLGIGRTTLFRWRKEYPDIKDAISTGREEANAAVLTTTFNQALRGDIKAQELWWRYRIARSEETDSTSDAPTIVFSLSK